MAIKKLHDNVRPIGQIGRHRMLAESPTISQPNTVAELLVYEVTTTYTDISLSTDAENGSSAQGSK